MKEEGGMELTWRSNPREERFVPIFTFIKIANRFIHTIWVLERAPLRKIND